MAQHRRDFPPKLPPKKKVLRWRREWRKGPCCYNAKEGGKFHSTVRKTLILNSLSPDEESWGRGAGPLPIGGETDATRHERAERGIQEESSAEYLREAVLGGQSTEVRSGAHAAKKSDSKG